jgi:hypothetical protein
MDCIDINFSVIISSDIYDRVNTSAGGVLVHHGIIRQYFDFSFGTSGNILLGTGIEYRRLHCL